MFIFATEKGNFVKVNKVEYIENNLVSIDQIKLSSELSPDKSKVIIRVTMHIPAMRLSEVEILTKNKKG